MESPSSKVDFFTVNQFPDAFHHLGSSLIGEGKHEKAVLWHAFHNPVGDAVGQDAGLPRSRVGNT